MADQFQLGPFVVYEHVASGGMGDVWRGQHEPSTPVAVKVVTEQSGRPGLALPSLLTEIRAVARLDHPHIVRILHQGTAPETGTPLRPSSPYFVLEWAPETLQPHIGSVDFHRAAAITEALLSALGYAHARSILHRDLKPSNVLLRDDGTVALTDFGLAAAPGTEHGFASGTPRYMAPEQFDGRWRDEGPHTDLYQLGCLLWTVFTGAPPFGATDPAALASAHLFQRPGRFVAGPDVPPGIEHWLRSLLVKDPFARLPTAAEAALEFSLVTGRPAALSPPERNSRLRPHRVGTGLDLIDLREPPLVGRDPTLARAGHRIRQVAEAGAKHHIHLDGPSGVGKSRLAAEIAFRAAEWGALPVRFTADGSARQAIDTALGSQQLEGEDLRRRIGDRLPGLSPVEREALIRGLRPSEQDAGAPLSALFALALRGIAEFRPIAVMADQATGDAQQLVQALLRSPGPVLAITTDTELAPSAGTPEAVVETIEAIDTAATQQLLASVLALESETLARLSTACAGSPLFAVELARHLIHTGMLETRGELLGLKHGSQLTLPDHQIDWWAARFEEWMVEVDPHPLAALFVLGLETNLQDWWAVADTSPAQAWRAIEPLQHAGWLLFDGVTNRLRFAHALIRDAARVWLESRGADLRALHARAAVYLHEQGAEPDRIGSHWIAAGRPGLALRPLIRGLVRTSAAGDRRRNHEVWASLRTAATDALGPDDPIHVDIARAAVVSSGSAEDPTQAMKAAERCLRLALRIGTPERIGDAKLGVANTMRRAGNLQGTEDLVRDAVAAFSEADDSQKAKALNELGWDLVHQGRLDEADACFQQAMQLLQGWTGPPGDVRKANTYNGLISVRRQTHQHNEALALLEELRIELERQGSIRWMPHFYINRAEVERLTGQFERALASVTTGTEIARRHHIRSSVLLAAALGAQICLDAGDPESAIPWIERALEANEAVQHSTYEVVTRCVQLTVLAHQGDWDGWDGVVPRVRELLADPSLFVEPDIETELRRAADAASQFDQQDRAMLVRAMIHPKARP